MKGFIKLNDLVKYHGEHETCHGFIYKITKVYDNTWFDLELLGEFDPIDCIYKSILSAQTFEIEPYDPIEANT